MAIKETRPIHFIIRRSDEEYEVCLDGEQVKVKPLNFGELVKDRSAMIAIVQQKTIERLLCTFKPQNPAIYLIQYFSKTNWLIRNADPEEDNMHGNAYGENQLSS